MKTKHTQREYKFIDKDTYWNINISFWLGGCKIDRRTWAGKELTKKIKTMNKQAAEEFNCHYAIKYLRIKDYELFINIDKEIYWN